MNVTKFVLFKHISLIVLIGLVIQPAIIAHKKQFVLKNTEIIQLKSELTNREHELVIFLPGSYKDSVNKKYPVLYFMDAYWDMPLLHSIHGQLVYDNIIPELIMVGFSYPGENTDYGDLRTRDLSPTKIEQLNPNSGDGPKFLQFIEETVIPYIESNYRTDKKQRALGGSSMGGLFTLFAMYEKPNLFKRYISISPAAIWENDYLSRKDKDYSKNHKELPVRLFLSAGSDEYNLFRDPIITLQKQIAKNNYKKLALLNYIIESERHSSVKSEGYSRGLRWVFKDIAPVGPSGLAVLWKGRIKSTLGTLLISLLLKFYDKQTLKQNYLDSLF